MNGRIDESGRALLEIELRPTANSSVSMVDVWIDTGFTGDLVLPSRMIDALRLSKSGSVDAILADGSAILVTTYTCLLNWFGEVRQLEVIANQGEQPLLGVGLLLGLELSINYRSLKLTLNEG
jgi:clan AA aspartic protease